MGQGSDVWELLAVALREAVVGPMILKMHHFSSLGGLRERKRESEGGREGGREGKERACVWACVSVWRGFVLCALCESVYLSCEEELVRPSPHHFMHTHA